MLNAFGYLSCFKLCWHNRPGPNSARPVSIAMALFWKLLAREKKSVTSLLWLLKVEKYTIIRVNRTIKEVCACLMHKTIVTKLLHIVIYVAIAS